MKRGKPLRADPEKTRAWKDRSRKNNPLDRSTPINPVGDRKKRRKRWEDAFGSEAYVQWVKGLPCIVEDCERRDIECAHVKSRGAGGGPEHIVPLCALHHREQHDRGVETVQDEWGLDLDLEAARVWQEWTG